MSQTHTKPNPRTPSRTPRWVKAFGLIALIMILLLAILMFSSVGGEHGPGRHIPPLTPTIETEQP